MTEKRFHPFAVLHLLRKTILLYLLPLVQVLFARNWAALWAALVQDLVLFALLSAACWAVLRVSGWQMDAHGNLLVRWRLGIRLDRTLRADMLAALTIDRPVVYRLAGASQLTLYPAGQKKPLTLIVARDDARELADRLLPLEQPVVHRPHGGEKAGAVPAADGSVPHHAADPHPAAAGAGPVLCRSAGGGFCGLPPGGRMDAGRSPDPAAAEGVPPALRLCPASGPVPDGTAVPVGSGGPSCQPDPDFSGPTEAEGAQCGPNGACFFTAGRMIKRRRFS